MLTVVEKVILLQAVDVFTEVPTHALAYVAAIAEEEALEPGQVVYREADPPDSMYVVLTGRVRLQRAGRDVTQATQGQAFGTWALFDDEPRVVSAIAADAAEVLRIDKDAFLDVLADNVDIARGIIKAMARRLRALATRVTGGRGGATE